MNTVTYTKREEIAHSVTHGLGVALGIAGMVLLIVWSSLYGDVWHVVSSSIYGTALVALYLASTLYHSVRREELKRLFRKFDHAAIFLLIAGTYTPFLLVSLRGPWGWSLFGIVWGLAFVGVAMKFWLAGRYRVLSTIIYIGMGWMILVAYKPLVNALPSSGMRWLLAGGLCYSAGTVFYLWKRMPYHHAVWHLWVLAGSICHWTAVFGYVVPDA